MGIGGEEGDQVEQVVRRAGHAVETGLTQSELVEKGGTVALRELQQL